MNPLYYVGTVHSVPISKRGRQVSNPILFDKSGQSMKQSLVPSIEEGRERHVTSYLRQWTQLIRLYGRGVLKCGWLYWQDYSRPHAV